MYNVKVCFSFGSNTSTNTYSGVFHVIYSKEFLVLEFTEGTVRYPWRHIIWIEETSVKDVEVVEP